MEMQGVWKQHLRPRAVVGYGVKIFLPSPPNYVTRSPGNKPNGNYFMENECVRFLITKSEVAGDERISTENEWDFLFVSRSE